jgi:2-oxo-4-hydroxy-4-carboxy--5-ureidoimidazoline (OHCU) decarboxylase
MKLPILILLASSSLLAVPEGRAARPEGKPGAERPNQPGRPDLAEIRKKLEAMSPEQRREYLENHPEIKEKLANLRDGKSGPAHPDLADVRRKLEGMTPEERKEFLEKHPELKERLAGAKDKIDNLTPEQKEKLKDRAKEKLENLTPEQKEKLKARMKERLEKATPEQKEQMRARLKEKLDGMSPEQKEAFLKDHPEAAELLK